MLCAMRLGLMTHPVTSCGSRTESRSRRMPTRRSPSTSSNSIQRRRWSASLTSSTARCATPGPTSVAAATPTSPASRCTCSTVGTAHTHVVWEGKKEGNVLFNDTLNTFYLWLYGIGHTVEDHSENERGNHMGYSFWLTARVLLYAQSHSNHHSLSYASRGALAGMGNRSMGSPLEGSIRQPIAPWVNALTMELLLVQFYLMWERERNVLFNDALNTFYLRLYGIRHMVKDQVDSEKENPLPPIGYSYRLTARVLLYAPSHRQDNTYHDLCYTSCGALAGTRNSSMGPPHEGSIQWPIAPWVNILTMALLLVRFYLMMLSTHFFINRYMASDIW